MMHNKHHWDDKSFMTPQANKSVKSLRQDQEILELLEAFLYLVVLQIFVHDSCET